MGAIEGWVATGSAPKQIVAAHRTAGKVDKTRLRSAASRGREVQGRRRHQRRRELHCALP
jgi:hypothetical protein